MLLEIGLVKRKKTSKKQTNKEKTKKQKQKQKPKKKKQNRSPQKTQVIKSGLSQFLFLQQKM